jgi:hypothetical protein
VSKKKKEIEPKSGSNTVYIALVGLNYGDPEKRVEAGEEVSDLSEESILWLLKQGCIKPKEVE